MKLIAMQEIRDIGGRSKDYLKIAHKSIFLLNFISPLVFYFMNKKKNQND